MVDLNLDENNRIRLLADHPEGITLEQLGLISRSIEQQLDRDDQDFALDVSSPGVGEPLRVMAQYHQNVGRPVKLRLSDQREVKGELVACDGQALRLCWTEKQPKEKGKGKVKVQREEEFDLKNIEETRVEIRFS